MTDRPKIDNPTAAQKTALWTLMTAKSWGGAIGAIAEGEPEVVKLIDEHDKKVAAKALEKVRQSWIDNGTYPRSCQYLLDDLAARAAAIRRGEV